MPTEKYAHREINGCDWTVIDVMTVTGSHGPEWAATSLQWA